MIKIILLIIISLINAASNRLELGKELTQSLLSGGHSIQRSRSLDNLQHKKYLDFMKLPPQEFEPFLKHLMQSDEPRDKIILKKYYTLTPETGRMIHGVNNCQVYGQLIKGTAIEYLMHQVSFYAIITFPDSIDPFIEGSFTVFPEIISFLLHGRGTTYHISTRKKKYEGDYFKGERHGNGILYYDDGGMRFKGEWEYGEYKEGVEYDQEEREIFQGSYFKGKPFTGKFTVYHGVEIEHYFIDNGQLI